tara:strand:+ start:624 stop:791 length:168 start_codon:yes stop_codon:yes gene_type:complete
LDTDLSSARPLEASSEKKRTRSSELIDFTDGAYPARFGFETIGIDVREGGLKMPL